MSTLTRTAPVTPHADRFHNLVENKDHDMTTIDVTTLDLIAREAEISGREPLAPDSPRPPGGPIDLVDLHTETTDVDESLAARAAVARCADGNGTLTGLFFSDSVVDIARAKAMCALCPLRFECLQGALEREEPWGVWGGELLSGGRIVANKRPCGRPPKHPRPEIVYDEMGPVDVVA